MISGEYYLPCVLASLQSIYASTSTNHSHVVIIQILPLDEGSYIKAIQTIFIFLCYHMTTTIHFSKDCLDRYKYVQIKLESEKSVLILGILFWTSLGYTALPCEI